MVEVDKIHFRGSITTANDGWGGWVFEDCFLSCESAFIPCIGKLADGEEGAVAEVWEDGGFAGDGRRLVSGRFAEQEEVVMAPLGVPALIGGVV